MLRDSLRKMYGLASDSATGTVLGTGYHSAQRLANTVSAFTSSVDEPSFALPASGATISASRA